VTDRAQRVARARLFPDFDGDTEELIRALADVERRIWAARWLGELGEQRAVPGLVKLSRASNPHVRTAAVRALGDLRARDALPRLIEMAENDPNPVAQSWSAGALGEIGSPEVVPLLKNLLRSPERIVRQGAVYALGLIGNPSVVPALREARRTDRRLRPYPFLGRHVYRQAMKRIKNHERAQRKNMP